MTIEAVGHVSEIQPKGEVFMVRLWSTVAIATLGLASPAVAQRPNQWTTECSTDRMTDKRACNVAIIVDPRKRPEDLLAVQVTVATRSVGVVGPRYGAGARIRVDNHPAVPMTGCDRSICVLLPQQAAGLIQQMRSGSTMLVEFTTVHGQKVGPWEVSLSGFDAEYQRAAAGR